jgi:hypothetical protein
VRQVGHLQDVYGDVWSLVDGALVSATSHCSSGNVYQSSLLQLNGVVSDSSLRDVTLLAALGIEMTSRRIGEGY